MASSYPTESTKGRVKTADEPLFEAGSVVCTPAALQVLTDVDIAAALYSHVRGDWGDVCREDGERNERSLRDGSRLLSAYHTADGVKFWVITRSDRTFTGLMLLTED